MLSSLESRDGRKCQSRSPLSSVEDIQRRLIQPISSQQQHSDLKLSARSPELARINTENAKSDDNRIARLEDYLDPVLLSMVTSKYSAPRKNHGKRRTPFFEWPTEQIQAMNCTEIIGRKRQIWSDITSTFEDSEGDESAAGFQACDRAIKSFRL